MPNRGPIRLSIFGFVFNLPVYQILITQILIDTKSFYHEYKLDIKSSISISRTKEWN